VRPVPPPDDRRAGGSILAAKRQPDGTWLLDVTYDDGLGLPLDEVVVLGGGEPSRWNTLGACACCAGTRRNHRSEESCATLTATYLPEQEIA
jgi:hypothetical protein